MQETKQQIENLKSGQIFHEGYDYWFIILRVIGDRVHYLEGSNPTKLIKKQSTIEELYNYMTYDWDRSLSRVKFDGFRPDIEELIKKYLD